MEAIEAITGTTRAIFNGIFFALPSSTNTKNETRMQVILTCPSIAASTDSMPICSHPNRVL
mgnify:CR=1 FL=1